MNHQFGPGSFTAISSTAVSSTNKYLDFKVRLVSIHYFLVRFMENPLWNSLLTFHFVEVKVNAHCWVVNLLQPSGTCIQRSALEQTI